MEKFIHIMVVRDLRRGNAGALLFPHSCLYSVQPSSLWDGVTHLDYSYLEKPSHTCPVACLCLPRDSKSSQVLNEG